MNQRQQRFLERYLELGNIAEAALEAGYTMRYGYELLRNEKIKAYLAEFRAEKEAEERRNTASEREILEFLSSVMQGEVDFDKNASTARMKAAELLGKRIGVFESRTEEAPKAAVVVDDL